MSEFKCHTCLKKTDLNCTKCNIPICAEHSYSTHKKFYCAPCFLRERRIGVYKGFFGLMAILIAGLVVILIVK